MRFKTKTLLVITALFCLLFGAYARVATTNRAYCERGRQLQRRGYLVVHNRGLFGVYPVRVIANCNFDPDGPSVITAADLELLASLGSLRYVTFIGAVQRRPRPQYFECADCLKQLKALQNLKGVRLLCTGITEQDIGFLQGMHSLESIYVLGVPLSDPTVDALCTLPNLEELRVLPGDVSVRSAALIKALRLDKPADARR
ncbi:MAG: hypothetical protein AAF790_05925 [Planctomycetota bacterium]